MMHCDCHTTTLQRQPHANAYWAVSGHKPPENTYLATCRSAQAITSRAL